MFIIKSSGKQKDITGTQTDPTRPMMSDNTNQIGYDQNSNTGNEVNTNGNKEGNSKSPNKKTPAKSGIKSTDVTPSSKIYSQGQLTVHSTFTCDLDLGREGGNINQDIDFWWNTMNYERYLVPENGKFYIMDRNDFAAITANDLRNLPYSSDKINGSNNSMGILRPGVIIAAKTNLGKYAKLRIDACGDDLTISWVTYEFLNK